MNRRSIFVNLASVTAALGLITVSRLFSEAAEDPCPRGQTRNTKGQCVCPPGTTACPDGCFNLRNDEQNCGACGNICPPNTECLKGTCR